MPSAALKGSAKAQFHLFGLAAVFRSSISCALHFQVRHSWILDVFHILTHFIQNRPHEISKVAHFNPLNAELNPTCYFLALFGAHHFLHVSRIRVKSLTLRLLMSYIYIYIYIYMEHLFLMFLDHTTTHHSR